ncbi:MAG: n-acetylglutamate synthase [Defluviitaleaceae bacterium]|nr:n-acetylglutamate synthase [Defluviitaleaceae bacterium]
MINYNNKKFAPISNSENGEVSESTIFNYYQEGQMLWADYSGADIKKGFLIGVVNDDDSLDFSYQHLNHKMEIRMGNCHSMPQVMPDGKLQLYETWQWLNGDCSKGESMLKEV